MQVLQLSQHLRLNCKNMPSESQTTHTLLAVSSVCILLKYLLSRPSIIFHPSIITITLWAKRGGNSPSLVTVYVPPLGLRSGRICETLTDNPFIKPVKLGWQMCLRVPKMPTLFRTMEEWRSWKNGPSWKTESSSRVRLYHSHILRRDSWVQPDGMLT